MKRMQYPLWTTVQQSFRMLTTALLFMPLTMMGQSYESLWKQVEQAQNKDLPQTAMTQLRKMETKATKEKAYGWLLRSSLLYAKLQAEVAPDSLAPAVKRLEQREQAAKDVALKAVYDVVLAKVYETNQQLTDNWKAQSDSYRRQAMTRPDVLAQTQIDSYVPFVVKEKDSECFGHDLLSVVGMELNEWKWMSNYYSQIGNRPAACLSACQAVSTIEGMDSLLNIYGNLPEAGEIAIKRYELMSDDRFTAAEKNSWIEQSLNRWGTWKRSNILRNAQTALNNPTYQVHIDNTVHEVGKPQMIQLTNLRNIERLTMHVYRTTLAGDTKLNINNKDDLKQIQKVSTLLNEHTKTLSFTGHASYDFFRDSLELNSLPAGVYVLMFRTEQDTQVKRMLYFVSGIRVISQAQPHNMMRYVVVDATTGQPVPNAQLRMTFHKGNDTHYKTLACNQQGEVTYNYEKERPSSVFAFTSTDNCCPEFNNYGNYSYYERQYNVEHTTLFADRSIYRPGQTVHVAAIAWKEVSATENAAISSKQLTLTLRDANYKVVSEQQVMTDRYGKCAADFTLPTGLLNGHFTVQCQGSSVAFNVEEYKRPTFQVKFADYKQSYRNGDTIQVQGKALTYAGVPVQGAKVKYTVKRRVAFWWMSYSRYWNNGYIGHSLKDEVLNEGEAVTEEDGTFCANVPMVLPTDLGNRSMFYHFVVEADVTDQGGETHSGTLSLPLGNKSTVLTCDIPQRIRNDQMPQITFTRRNAAGNEIAGTVRYRMDNGKWKECAANAHLSPLTSRLSSGQHRIEAICEQDTLNTSFVVFSLNDKKPAAETHDWFYVSDTQFPNDGKPVTVQVGSSDPNLHIVYGIYAGDQQIESGAVDKDAALINRKFTYNESYGNGLLLTFAWVKDGQCYRHSQFIQRPMPDKQLKLQWETFRDRLTPGQQEEWRLTIKKPDGTAADASFMAVLYDKSLDAIKQHHWSFTPTSYLPQPGTSWQWRSWSSIGLSGAKHYQSLRVPSFTYSYFDSSVIPTYMAPVLFRNNHRVMIRGAKAAAAPRTDMMVMKQTAAIGSYDVRGNEETAEARDEVITVGYGGQQQKEEKAEEVQLRENLQETAFCYPTLTTATDGTVTMKFTLPESLTTWRFMGIANTSDMLYGSISGEAIAQKDIMIQPNMPRFIRMGDEARISARIFNTTERAISGTAKLQLIDPATEQVVLEQQQPFAVAAQQTAATTFAVQSATFQESLLICKVVATGDGFSDGEQHYLPILPDREYVTKTVPYTQHEPGVKTVDLTKLFPQGTSQQKLTIEYTNNPAWLMVQSLPTLGQPWEHSAIDQAASFYSNMLAKTLLGQSPQVKNIFEQWKRETGAETSLTSHLAQNEELKDLVLEETPWIAAADREEEQKQRLADFFDENGMDNRLSTALEKLQKLQHADGSFSWYPGMEGSTFITVAVEEMLARLNILTGTSTVVNGSAIDITPIYDKAFNYMGQQMVDLVNKMKKEEKKGIKQSFPSFTALRWLYICAIDGRTLSSSVKSANNYLINLLKKDIKRQTIYEKAMSAIVLAQHGEKTKAAEYVKSLKEYTVYTEEMGRYYDTRRASYSWYDYKIPTEVAAIEAIQRVTPNDAQTVDEMRRWLLQEKRTQTWDTPINSVNAIYAFLNATPHSQRENATPHSHRENGNSQALTTTNAQTVLAIDGSPIDTPKATAGIGYVKTVVDASAVNNARTFTATKTSEGTLWGAVYAQFLQKTSDIESSTSGITIQREVMAAGPQSTSLTAQPSTPTALKVGDRIKVRITINTTRDLDFVQVIDRRAACMEPVGQLSGYRNGAYCSPKDNATHYFFGMLAKGRHVVETEYYIDRSGRYETGTCTVGCAYAPEYRATAPSLTINVNE